MKNNIILLITVCFIHIPASAGLGDLIQWGGKQLDRVTGKSADKADDAARKGRDAPPKPSRKDNGDDAVGINVGGAKSYKGSPLNDYTSEVRANANIKKQLVLVRKVSQTFRQLKGAFPVMLGPPGVGKTASWEYLAWAINSKQSMVKHLHGKKVVLFNVNEFFSGTQYQGTLEEKVTALIQELKERDDLIVVFDEFANVLSDEKGAKLMQELKTLMASGEMQAKMAFNMQEDQFTKHITDPGLLRRLNPITIKEPSPAIVRLILRGAAHKAQEDFGITVDPVLMEKINHVANKFPRDMEAEANPAFALKVFDSMIQSAVEEQQAGSMRIVQLKERLETIGSAIDDIEDGVKAGVPKFKGPYYQERLARAKTHQKQIKEVIDQYNADFVATEVDRAQLTGLISERRRLLEEQRRLESGGTEAADLAESKAQLSDVEEEIKEISTKIVQVNPNLVVSRMEERHLIEGLSVTKNMGERDVKKFLTDVTKRELNDVIGELEDKIAGQRAALENIVRRVMFRKAKLSQDKGMQTFLLLGPSTVGKTYLAKLLSETFTYNNMYTMPLGDLGKHSTAGLTDHIGANKQFVGSDDLGPLYKYAQETNGIFTLLSDEADKGPDAFWQWMMQPAREGISTSKGSINKDFNLKEALHIITSNAVTEMPLEVKNKVRAAASDAEKQELLKQFVTDYAQKNGHEFPPGALNRTYIVFMDQLEEEHIREVARIRLADKDYIRELEEEHSIGVEFDESVIDWITQRALQQNGTVKGVKDVIDDELAEVVFNAINKKQIVDGDVMRVKVVQSQSGEPELLVGSKPWSDTREVDFPEWDYTKFIEYKTQFLNRAKEIIQQEEFVRRRGVPDHVKVELSEWDPSQLGDLMPYYIEDIEDVESFLVNNAGLQKVLSSFQDIPAGGSNEDIVVSLKLNVTKNKQGQVEDISTSGSVILRKTAEGSNGEDEVFSLNELGDWVSVNSSAQAERTFLTVRAGENTSVWKLTNTQRLMVMKPGARAMEETDALREAAIHWDSGGKLSTSTRADDVMKETDEWN